MIWKARNNIALSLRLLSFIVTMAYPFVVVLAHGYFHSIVAILAILWAFRATIERNYAFVYVALFFGVLFFIDDMKFLYPLLINALFGIYFVISLKKEAIITRFARLKNPNLPPQAVAYTRNLTKIWIAFFGLNGLFSVILWFVSEEFWALYCGVISYILVAILFVGEMIFRRFCIGK